MEERVVKLFTVLISAVSSAVLLLILLFPGLHAAALQYQTATNLRTTSGGQSVMAILKSREMEKVSRDDAEAEKHDLRIELPNSISGSDITYKDSYLDKTWQISLPGLPRDYFFEHPIIGSFKGISDIRYEVRDGNGVIEFRMKRIYVCRGTESGRYLYLDFVRPRKYYDHVVVIDAGHGGNMPGASSRDGKVVEKDLNLAIVKQLKDVFDEAQDGSVGVYYTRLTDVNPDFADRVGLANELKADVFLSVHINSDPNPGEEYVSGTGVMYDESDETGRSKRFAKKCLRALVRELGTKSKRTIPGDEIYIIRNSKVPVALAEIGFITNDEELQNLVNKSYQRRTAEALHRAIIKTMNSFERE